MKLLFEEGRLYVDNMKFAYYGVRDGKLPTGTFAVEARYSHNHSKSLPYIESVGFVGASDDCAIVIGKVMGQRGVLPDGNAVSRLVACIETADETGTAVIAEIK